MPAENAPTPQARNIYPNWLTVEYARTFLMSVCTSPMVAAKNAVAHPMMATASIAVSEWANKMCDRATTYTPAVTMVAAWINALTGAGPSMASGNQTYNGSCADFPQAPMKSNKEATVSVLNCHIGSCGHKSALSKSFTKSRVSNLLKSKNIPSMNPKSPMRLTMNAFFPASAADFFKK